MNAKDKTAALTEIWENQIEGQEKYPHAWQTSPKSFISWSSKKYREGYVLQRKDANWDYRHGNLKFVAPEVIENEINDIIESEIIKEKELQKQKELQDAIQDVPEVIAGIQGVVGIQGAHATPSEPQTGSVSSVAPCISVEDDDDEIVVVLTQTEEPSFVLESEDAANEVVRVPVTEQEAIELNMSDSAVEPPKKTTKKKPTAKKATKSTKG